MKINWGTSIVIAFVLFAAMLTYYMIRGANNQVELVTDDYYEQEIKYQDLIDSKANAAKLLPLKTKKIGTDLHVFYPEDLPQNNTTGTLEFYRPNNKKLDFTIPVEYTQNTAQVIHSINLVAGRWVLKISIQSHDQNFFWERNIRI